MLLFTSDVRTALEWFDACYELEAGLGYVRWRRVALPTAGGLDEQPAKLIEQMAWIATVRNRDLQRQRPSRRRRKRTDKRG